MNPKGKEETLKGEAVTLKVATFQLQTKEKNQIDKRQTHSTGYTKYIKRNKNQYCLLQATT